MSVHGCCPKVPLCLVPRHLPRRAGGEKSQVHFLHHAVGGGGRAQRGWRGASDSVSYLNIPPPGVPGSSVISGRCAVRNGRVRMSERCPPLMSAIGQTFVRPSLSVFEAVIVSAQRRKIAVARVAAILDRFRVIDVTDRRGHPASGEHTGSVQRLGSSALGFRRSA